MSDITPMAAVPSEVNYGRIRANFVAFIADDNGNVLEEVPLEGNVILTPTVGVLRFPSTSPPRTAVIQTLQCPVIGGILYPPGTPLGGPFPSQTGVAAVASDQPAGLPTTVQWTASFSLENTSAQPNPVTFEVPSGGVVDLTTVMPATPEPGIVVVVSTEDRERAEAAREDAETASNQAVTARNEAVTAKNLAEGFAGEAETARDATLIAAAALQDTGWRNIGTLFINPEKWIIYSARLRRQGNLVTFTAHIKARETTGNFAELFVLPGGFRLSQLYAWLNPISPTNVLSTYRADNLLSVERVVAKDTNLFIQSSWTTSNPFPTPAAYPGTPA